MANQIIINQGQISVVDIITQGPQGPQGPPGPSGSEGNVNTSSLVTTSSFNSFTSSYNTGSFTGSFTGSLFGTSSFTLGGSGSFSGSFSGSGANLNSIPANAIVGLSLTQITTGSVTASVTPTQFTVRSGSVVEFTVAGTGVTIGNLITDTHTVTGSLNITGSQRITGSLNVSQGITGSLLGTSSFAQNSLTASYVTTLNQDLIVTEGYKIYISSSATPSAGISSYLDPISQLVDNGQYSGETIKGIAGSQLLRGELIYLYTDGLWYKADATPDSTNGASSATSLLGMHVGSEVAELNDNIVILLQGIINTNVISGIPNPGVPLWVGAGGDPGRIQRSEPSSKDNVVRQVGRTITSNIIRFAPDNYFSIIP
jgi:hypothetical protein